MISTFQFLFCLLFSSTAFSQSTFFENIEKYPEKNQIQILERRIELISKTDLKLGGKKTFDVYFQKNKNFSDALGFFLDKYRNAKKIKAKKRFNDYLLAGHFFDGLKSVEFFEAIPILNTIEDIGFRKRFYIEINQRINANHIPSVLRHRDLIKKALLETGLMNKTYLWQSLDFSVNFGFFDIFDTLAEKQAKIISTEPIMKLKKCLWYLFKGEQEEALSCIQTEDSVPYKVYGAYFTYVLKKENPSEKLFNDSHDFAKKRKAISFQILIELLRVFMTKSSKNVIMAPFAELNIVEEPWTVLQILSVDRKVPFLNVALRQNYKNVLIKKYKGTWFEEVYMAQDRGTLLKAVFPEISFSYQSVL